METDGRSGGTGCSVKITIQMEAYMLVTAKEMLEKARDGKYAVGHFNINNLEWTKAILQTAEELRSPVILGVSEGAGKYMTGFKTVVGMVNGMLEEMKITVPVAPISSAVHWICGIFPFIVGDEADVKFTQISSKNFLPLSFSEQAQSLSVL